MNSQNYGKLEEREDVVVRISKKPFLMLLCPMASCLCNLLLNAMVLFKMNKK